jgi:peptidoglycan/LPS O-acetylase OafA/YrhL
LSTGSVTPDTIRYRPDIDGLRAIAVLAVVAFHVSQPFLPGGYLGVDIFFVLSGFLITSIVWSDITTERFSIVRFYDRRLRRIMPAMLVLLVITTLTALALLLPAGLIGYGKSLLSTLGFVANVYFWRDTDYFSADAAEKPLLHLWSLGVEEQFYILFPLTLLLLARWWPRGALASIIALTIGSLITNVLALRVGGAAPAFFLLPTRAWELGVGAALAVVSPDTAPGRGSRPVANVIAVLGLLLLLGGLIHPLAGYANVPVAVPVVIGTGLLIFAGRAPLPLVNRLLGVRPLVFCGLISYSLYLWHWPILVFERYYMINELTAGQLIPALALMMCCAVLSWKYVERPFRSRSMSISAVRLTAGAGVAALGVGAFALIASNGVPGRLSADAAVVNAAVGSHYRCPMSEYLQFGAGRACQMNLRSRDPNAAEVVLLGNSHAQMYEPVWRTILAGRGANGLLVPINSCLPTVSANLTRECAVMAVHNLDSVTGLTRVRTVIVGMTWWHGPHALVDESGNPVDNSDNAALIAAVDDLIRRLRGSGKQVILIGPIAEPGWDVASVYSRELAFGRPLDRLPFMPAEQFNRHFATVMSHFDALSDIHFVRPDRIQCDAKRCNFLLDGRSLFADSNHIAAAELWRYHDVFAAALAN